MQSTNTLRGVLQLGDRQVDLARLRVLGEGLELRLTPTEAKVLLYLWSQRGRTVPRAELLSEVWGYGDGVVTRTLDATVARLRSKVEANTRSPAHLLTVRGVGYRLEGVDSPPEATGRTRFFGRTEELASLAALGSGDGRLVTIVGPGGAGKTRLTRELGASVGHAWCDLQHLEDGVMGAVAAALRLPAGGSEERTAMEVGALLGRPGAPLLILDNAEHLADEVARCVCALLPRGGRILVTSRAPLRVGGEHLLRLGPLPPREAVALLVDRARAIRPGFGRGPHDAEHLDACVRLVDCLPLAVELAAARADLRSAESLRQGLEEPVSFLRDDGLTPRDAPRRHMTLDALLGRSWDRLDPPAQAGLLRCSVFAAPFEPEAGEALAGAAALRTLAEGNLLMVEEPVTAGGAPRLRMLETVRSFCVARHGDEARAESHRAHRRWFEARAAALQLACRDDDRQARDALAAISPDVVWAARHALEDGDAAAALEALLALRFLVRLGSIALRPDRFVALLLQALRLDVEDELRARTLICLASEQTRMADHDAVDVALDEAEALALALASPKLQGRALNIRVRSLSARSRFEEATAAALAGIELAASARDLRIQAHLTLDLANVRKRVGDLARSAEGLLDARSLYERAGDRTGLSIVLVNLAGIAFYEGRMTEARSLFADAHRIQTDEGDEARAACTALYLAFLAVIGDEAATARAMLDAAVPVVLLRAAPSMRAFAHRIEGMERILAGELDEAADRLRRAAETCSLEHLRRVDRGLLGQVRALQRRRREVSRLLQEQLAGEDREPPGLETRTLVLHAELLARLAADGVDAPPGRLPAEQAAWLRDQLPTLTGLGSSGFAIRVLRAELDPSLVALL